MLVDLLTPFGTRVCDFISLLRLHTLEPKGDPDVETLDRRSLSAMSIAHLAIRSRREIGHAKTPMQESRMWLSVRPSPTAKKWRGQTCRNALLASGLPFHCGSVVVHPSFSAFISPEIAPASRTFDCGTGRWFGIGHTTALGVKTKEALQTAIDD